MAGIRGVLLRGLPFSVSLEDIVSFFNTLTIHRDKVEMIYMYSGKFSGLAYVELRNKDEIKMALLMDRNHIGDRYIDVMEVSEDKVDQIRKAAISGIGRLDLHRMCAIESHDRGASGSGFKRRSGQVFRERSRSPMTKNPRTRFAYVTGFPENTLYKGIRSFFDGCIIGTGCVHLFRLDNDKFRGDGYVEFASSEELKKALRLNKALYKGTHEIIIEPCSEEELMNMRPYVSVKSRTAGGGGSGGRSDESFGSYRARSEPYNQDYDAGPSYYTGSRGRSRHSFGSGSRQDMSPRRYRHSNMDRRDYPPAESYSFNSGRHYDNPRRDYDLSYTTDRYPSSYTSSHHSNHSSSGHGSKNKTLRVEGMSSSTGISDVVAFFKNYGVEYENVRIQCYDDGTPNGKAFVTFPSERIASAAYHDMNQRPLKNTYIELFLVT
jgi:heterogeneous nuclear ribonucleoprotein F/H